MVRCVFIFFLFFVFILPANSQIIIDTNPPYNNSTWLINNILLGGGIVASNHSFQGDPNQIGFFNGINSNLGIDSGIVLSTGNVLDLVGPNALGSTSTAYNLPGDPTLDAIIAPDPTNDAAVLEFDFVPTSDVISFTYVFGSEEYLEFVASFNDVFGFFLSGPNPAGGNYVDENLAIIPGTVNTPVSIFNVNNVANSTYYIDNGTGSTPPQNTDATVIQFDGFTTPLVATADVNCGDTYHIKLVVADAVDWAYDSGIFLEAGSFYSPPLQITDDLSIDSTIMNIPCNGTITLTANGGPGATYQWYDSLSNIISTSNNVNVGPGTYLVSADIQGCATLSDTLTVIDADGPFFNLGMDFTIPCNTDTTINAVVSGGLGIYTYNWTDGINQISTNSSINIGQQGIYSLEVDDGTGCVFIDTISVYVEDPPNAFVTGGGVVCDDGSIIDVVFTFDGLLPWDLSFTDGVTQYNIDNIQSTNYIHPTSFSGQYSIDLVEDVNNCLANLSGNVDVIIHPLPIAQIFPNDTTIYIGSQVDLSVGDYISYEWYTVDDSLISINSVLSVSDSGRYYVWIEDNNGCTDVSEIAIVRTIPKTELFVPSAFTPNDDEHNELFVIQGLNIVDFHIEIFNRWGQLMFESDSLNKSWDGIFQNKRVQQGTYYYQIEVLGSDNKYLNKSGLLNVIY